ncbi:MAG TPA: hypothetical protein VF137_05585 [Candidatus Dormibacteraeota bacterium]
MSYYAYRPGRGRRIARTDVPPRYFSVFDRLMVGVGLLAFMAFVGLAIFTRGSMLVDLFTRIVTNR